VIDVPRLYAESGSQSRAVDGLPSWLDSFQPAQQTLQEMRSQERCPNMIFYDYTLAFGEIVSRRTQDTRLIERRAKQHMLAFLPALASEQKVSMSRPWHRYAIRLAIRDDAAALATFYHDDIPVTFSIILAGISPRLDAGAVAAMTTIIEEIFPDHVDYGFRMIDERPVLMTLMLPGAVTAIPDAIGIIADMETVLAAALLEQFMASSSAVVMLYSPSIN
jgi:hypothetical protein